MQLGDIEISLLTDGHFHLDGGAMFGIVPRVLWEKKSKPDDANRIRLALRCMLIRTGNRVIVVDTGFGNKQPQKFRDRYALEQPVTLVDDLRRHGVRPGDVTDVINCHLHFDHAGWNTVRDGDRVVPTFPNARYWSQRGEWERARDFETQKDRGSFLPEDYLPIEESRWELPEGEGTVAPGVSVFPVPGHSPFTQAVLISAGNRKVAFLGDLIPTVHHVPTAWIMAFDLYPVQTLATKRAVLPQAMREKWLVVFDHDPEVPAGYIVEDGKGDLTVAPSEEFAETAVKG